MMEKRSNVVGVETKLVTSKEERVDSDTIDG